MKSFLNIFAKKTACFPLINLQGEHVEKYRVFRDFLNHNNNALKIISDLEQIFYSGKPFTLPFIRTRYRTLYEAVSGVISSLEEISGKDYAALKATLQGTDHEISKSFERRYAYPNKKLVIRFEDIAPDMKNMVGSKAFNLALMKNSLGIPVPGGFAITAYAFEIFLRVNSLWKPMERELAKINPFVGDLEDISGTLRTMIMEAEVPAGVASEILDAYRLLEDRTYKGVHIAMRSSAIGEDTEATFAGQYSTVLNVTKENIIQAYKTVLASKYSARALSYRLQYGLDERETPMCVAGVAMVDAKTSGVVYTAGFGAGDSDIIKISAIPGLGEYLVDGSASPDIYLLDKKNHSIIGREINRKTNRLVNIEEGGIRLEEIPESEREQPCIDDETINALVHYCLSIEDHFGGPQDIEWAVDRDKKLFILQARPLNLAEAGVEKETVRHDLSKYRILLSSGKTASEGIAIGSVFIVKEGTDLKDIPQDCILVAKTTSPDYAAFVGRIRGIITDIGSVTSHLSSIVREFGIPAIVDTRNSTSVLHDGQTITMSATGATVYEGVIEELKQDISLQKKFLLESPAHRLLRNILDNISPLNLTDPAQPTFSPEGCKTLHDIVRFTHEMSIKEMFGLTEEAEEVRSIRLSAQIPLNLHLIDLGGGLRADLTTCHIVTPEDIESIPMKALWKGFTHPGINWAGAVTVDAKKMLTLFAVSATSDVAEQAGGASYAILSRDYTNLSAKFGYHYATIDTLCGDNINQNYVSVQFSGGAGNYYGKSLRVSLLGNVLKRLGFHVSLKGDLLEAFLTGYDIPSMEEKIDQLGRLLASSRLLDMSLTNQGDIEVFTDAFFKEDYDFLSPKRADQPKEFYLHNGLWEKRDEDGHTYCIQDGSKSGYGISSGVAGIAGKLLGPSLQDFLDNIEAYYYFPLAIAKNSEIADGGASVKVKPVAGHIDRAGGIVFGLRNVSNYFVLRINALEDNVILFEYVNSKRIQRTSAGVKIETSRWYSIGVEISDAHIAGYLDGTRVIEYLADKPVKGLVGLWTKADSVTFFEDLTIRVGDQERKISF